MATTVTLKPNAIDISGSTSGTTTLQATAVAGTTTITLPAATDTLVGRATTDTLTNKTLTTPVISSLSSASATALTLQSAGTTAVTIDTSQNVGIGTTSPGAPIDVVSNAQAIGTRIRGRSADSYGVLEFTNNGASAETARIAADSSANIIFSNTGSVTERMRIDSSGNLLVGKTSQTNTGKLEIDYSRATHAGTSYNETSSSSSCTHIAFQRGGTGVGSISSPNTSSTAYNTSSDYRLKEDIAPMTGALAKVALLKPVTYKWKVDGSDGEGFIAHELAEVKPDCVSGEKDAVDAEGKPIYQGIDTSFLVATLTAALQETKALLDTQAETINALTARIVALESK